MTRFEKNLRFYVGNTLGNSTILFFLNKYRNFGEGNIISSKTQLCVEGFQRSGNSYFINFFKMVNVDVQVAHHYHSAVQIIKAVTQQTPVVLLIREPKDAIASLITWDNRLNIGTALASYIQFYNKVLPVKQHCLIVHFETLVKGIDPIIEDINKRFETTFLSTNFSVEHHTLLLKEGEYLHNDLQTSPYPNQLKAAQNNANRLKVQQHRSYKKAFELYHKF